MNSAFAGFLSFDEQDRRDVFEAAANRLDTLPSYVEKDLWVCVVLDASSVCQKTGTGSRATTTTPQ